jgi:hypothetical protein
MIALQTVANDGIAGAWRGLRSKSTGYPKAVLAATIQSAMFYCFAWHYAKESKVPAAKSIPVRII